MRLQWTQDLDIGTLEDKGHWATMEELLEVVTFHLPRYENTVKMCKTSAGEVNPSDLTFATKFVAMHLLIKVKGSRPMTYQYLTVDMVSAAKENGESIDQNTFKTASKYGFDSLILTDTSMQVLDEYITFVRPLLKSQCDSVLAKKIEANRATSLANWFSTHLENTFIRRVIVKLLKRKASIYWLVKSKAFSQRTKNTALLLSKFTIKSRDRAKLLWGLTSIYKNYKETRVQRWTRTCTPGLALQLQVQHHQQLINNQQARSLKKMPRIPCTSPQIPCAFKKVIVGCWSSRQMKTIFSTKE